MSWHLITCEYPPDVGGISDHTAQLASGLAAAGDEVHVYCPGAARPARGRHPRARGAWRVRVQGPAADRSADRCVSGPAALDGPVGAARLRAAIAQPRLLPLGGAPRSCGRSRGPRGARALPRVRVGAAATHGDGGRAPADDRGAAARRRSRVDLDPGLGVTAASVRAWACHRDALVAGARLRDHHEGRKRHQVDCRDHRGPAAGRPLRHLRRSRGDTARGTPGAE